VSLAAAAPSLIGFAKAAGAARNALAILLVRDLVGAERGSLLTKGVLRAVPISPNPETKR